LKLTTDETPGKTAHKRTTVWAIHASSTMLIQQPFIRYGKTMSAEQELLDLIPTSTEPVLALDQIEKD
jgi:hypothetical protein